MSHTYSVKQSEEICKILNALRLRNFYLMSIWNM